MSALDDARDEHPPEPLPDAFVEYAFSSFISLMVTARQMQGESLTIEDIVEFLIVLGRNPAETRIQVNGEDRAWTIARATRSMDPGDVLRPGDLHSAPGPVPPRPKHGYLAGERADERWRIRFNFEIFSPDREAHLLAADEFRRAAHHAGQHGLERPFVENTFLAVEHLARAELLSYGPTLDLVENAKTHRTVSSIYNLWARLGNTQQRFADLLNQFGAARASIVYSSGSGATYPDPEQSLRVLDDMHAHVARTVAGDGLRSIRVVATRDIKAGMLIGPEDFSLNPKR